VITIFTGNRSPSVTATITTNGTPVDLTGATVRFRMRLEETTTLKVDAVATIVNAVAGQVRYDWAANDVDTPGDYIAWWSITLASGKTQDTPEFQVSVQDHYLPAETTQYLEREELKNTLSLGGMSFADEDLDAALSAASRTCDEFCHRRFWRDPATTNTRTYFAAGRRVLIDDLVELGSAGVTINGAPWVLDTDYYFEPMNAPSDGTPWTMLNLSPPTLAYDWHPYQFNWPRTIAIQGRWGWPVIPPQVQQATALLAQRFLRRQREAAFGVIGVGMDGSAVTIPRTDPDVAILLNPLRRLSVA
jgi:hypothetical protein